MSSKIAALQAKLGGNALVMGMRTPPKSDKLSKKTASSELDNQALMQRTVVKRNRKPKKRSVNFDELESEKSDDAFVASRSLPTYVNHMDTGGNAMATPAESISTFAASATSESEPVLALATKTVDDDDDDEDDDATPTITSSPVIVPSHEHEFAISEHIVSDDVADTAMQSDDTEEPSPMLFVVIDASSKSKLPNAADHDIDAHAEVAAEIAEPLLKSKDEHNGQSVFQVVRDTDAGDDNHVGNLHLQLQSNILEVVPDANENIKNTVRQLRLFAALDKYIAYQPAMDEGDIGLRIESFNRYGYAMQENGVEIGWQLTCIEHQSVSEAPLPMIAKQLADCLQTATKEEGYLVTFELRETTANAPLDAEPGQFDADDMHYYQALEHEHTENNSMQQCINSVMRLCGFRVQ